MNTCGKNLRGGGTCKLKAGHKGQHAGQGYVCDGCSEWRRGTPHQHGPEGMGFCFMCCRVYAEHLRSEQGA